MANEEMLEDFEDEEIDDEDQNDPQTRLRKTQRANSKLNKQLKDREARLVELETKARELSFVKAGVDPDDLKVQDFMAAYKGEDTVDAIREAAEQRGFIEPVSAATSSEVGDQQRISAAANGATPAGADQEAEYHDALDQIQFDGSAKSSIDKVVATARKFGSTISYDND